MKRFRWLLVILLGCLTYFTIGNASIFRIRAENTSIENRSYYELNQRINVGGYYTGSNARLRPAGTTLETATLYEQASANLSAR